MFGWLKKSAPRPDAGETAPAPPKGKTEPRYELALSDVQIALSYPGQPEVRANLSDVAEILVEISVSDPDGGGVWWLLLGSRGELLMGFPQDAIGWVEATARLRAFEGFDAARLADADACTIDGEFIVWRRDRAAG